MCADITGTHRWTISCSTLQGNVLRRKSQTYEVSVNGQKSAFFTFEPPDEEDRTDSGAERQRTTAIRVVSARDSQRLNRRA